MQILHHARIHTMDNSCSQADSLAFDQGQIVALGSFADLSARFPDAQCIDGQGRVVLPGFIDPHIHFLLGAVFQSSLDCSKEKIPNLLSLKSRLEKIAEETAHGQWIVGQGYDPLVYPGQKTPSRHDLDEACPMNPVMLVHYSCHECAVNSMALERLGITVSTPQPFGGEIEKDKRGLTGRLIEAASGPAMSLAVRDLYDQLEEQVLSRATEAEKLLFSLGITRIGDPAVSSREEALYEKAIESGALSLSVTVYPCDDSNFYGIPFAKAARKKLEMNQKLPMRGPIKFFLDGADRAALRITFKEALNSFLETVKRVISTRSMDPIRILLRSPARLGSDFMLHFGVKLAKIDELETCVRQAVANGHCVAFHALGNEAVEQAVKVMERVPYTHAAPARLEHAVFLRDKDIRAIGQNKMAVVTQPYFLTHMGPDNVPSLPGLMQLPLRSLMDQGVLVAGSSDWPVVSCDPLAAVERAVTRESTCGEVLQKNQAITVYEGLTMYTRNAAAVLGQGQVAGSLEPGKRADFIILSDDPFICDQRAIHKIRVEETYLGGARVFIRTQ